MKHIIRVENISKQYRIGVTKPRYSTLRESLLETVTKPLNFFKNKNISEKQNTIWALKDINFNVEPGNVIGIIGRNGAGKSTLLKIISRITKPTKGSVELYGRVGSLLEIGTGFHPELTGRENIFLNGTILGMKRHEVQRKFDEIVAFAEIEQFVDTPVKHYSSGMYMRLAFAVAAHLEPEILLVDEVLAVGDIEFQKKCLGKMNDVSKDGRTVLFVSHNLGSLSQICNSGILLHKGKLISRDNINKVIADYLGFAQQEKQFKLDDKEIDSSKGMQITEAFLTNNDGLVTDDFSHDEKFYLNFKVRISRAIRGAHYCVALLNKQKDRVFSDVKSIEEFLHPSNQNIHIKFEIPANFIAPNSYSFLICIFFPTGEIFENLFDVCPFNIIDTGSNLSSYKDYGYVQMRANWYLV